MRFFMMLYLVLLSFAIKANGLAIEPMSITVTKNNVSNVIFYNETNDDYILHSRVTYDAAVEDKCRDAPFLVNPPIRLAKQNTQTNLGVIYLGRKKECEVNDLYFLSVSAIPKRDNYQNVTIDVPIVVTQNMPIVFN
ncbi:TPA: fimbria/pilus periplasmic chaperone [Escherichia coli]|uniref:fimbria/pilus periplasmic chaperone n=1 Tax=Escherichia coli TaxID=562 RepID=UPI000DD2BB51|nr:fimbria/pilus periplasmic chaperone [Escherichia coli]EKG1501416.1 fimbria/pilus periplasmic chaperone [Escherichia coli]HCK2291294.1 fimbria/pilus periplasmic chaperone [Escherichia coli]HCK2314516.1 fimbria/pilus periplasmic chaperone [Escherichia coli]HCL9736863.1 fimbria/pilus periplasmic chaperone [Escherichia coli]HCL9915874.1 fimbria/pilus periplasmic chaperone [Escherichia coli]